MYHRVMSVFSPSCYVRHLNLYKKGKSRYFYLMPLNEILANVCMDLYCIINHSWLTWITASLNFSGHLGDCATNCKYKFVIQYLYVLANYCLITHQADMDQHQHSFGVVFLAVQFTPFYSVLISFTSQGKYLAPAYLNAPQCSPASY